jgi:hypothetical protein
VHVADRPRAQHDRGAAAQVLLVGLDAVFAQRAVHRGQREVRVEPRPLALVRRAVGEHQQLAAVEHLLRGLELEPLERALDRLRLQA